MNLTDFFKLIYVGSTVDIARNKKQSLKTFLPPHQPWATRGVAAQILDTLAHTLDTAYMKK